tara:strand:- start:252 stop:1280 length:1029 start_codon:yes stop_codon:yes gene_type:complete
MKKIKSNKESFLKKIFIKISRLLGYEIINQNSVFIPTSNKYLNENLSVQGEKLITVPMGEIKVTRPVKTLDVIIKSCTSVNLVSQNKKRLFDHKKSEYTFRTINSIIKSIQFSQKFTKNINYKISVIDSGSNEKDLFTIKNMLKNSSIQNKIINLNLDEFTNKIKVINKNNKIFENNMKSTMASILQSFFFAKENCEDITYFVEDDYIHKKESILELILTYEKLATLLKKEIFLCPVDYPYLYKSDDLTKVYLGHKNHWRVVEESLLTFLTSKKMLEKHWDKLIEMATVESFPYETALHKIYKIEKCFSPIPSLAMHCTNVNSTFGLSPNINWKKLWDDNQI